jgi:hypothetical protein
MDCGGRRFGRERNWLGSALLLLCGGRRHSHWMVLPALVDGGGGGPVAEINK